MFLQAREPEGKTSVGQRESLPVVLSEAKDLTERSDMVRVAGVSSFASLRFYVATRGQEVGLESARTNLRR